MTATTLLRTGSPRSDGRPRRRRWVGVIAGAGLIVLAAWLLSPRLVQFRSGAEVAVIGTGSTSLPGYEGGIEAIPYSHGEHAQLEISLTNEGPTTITVTGVELAGWNRPMLEVVDGSDLALRLGPGETAPVVLTGRFANCEYYTERAMDLYPSAKVRFETLGIAGAGEVALQRTLVVRSPTMIDCPDRVSDRGAKRRDP